MVRLIFIDECPTALCSLVIEPVFLNKVWKGRADFLGKE
jgi:hypothetical protein